MSTSNRLRSLTAPTDRELSDQLSSLAARNHPEPGKRQVNFTPVEVVLCLAAARVVRWNKYGGNNAHTAPSPVPELARLFKRSPASVLAKMANLFGGRSHAASYEVEAAAWYKEDPSRLDEVYARLLAVARDASFGEGVLPDFMPRRRGQA